jgi:hypothetical protein
MALAQVTGSLNKLTAKLEDLLTSSFSLIFTPGKNRMLPQGYNPAGQPRCHTSPSPLDLNQCQRQPAVNLGGPPPAALAALEQQEPARAAAAPSYRFSRQVVTVSLTYRRSGLLAWVASDR